MCVETSDSEAYGNELTDLPCLFLVSERSMHLLGFLRVLLVA